jgi:hypothetical protein
VVGILLWCAALAALPLPSRAQQAVPSAETVIRLNVQPMAAPKPALRYLLLPDLKEMNPGNPIPNYLKCTMEPDFFDRETSAGPRCVWPTGPPGWTNPTGRSS